MAKAQFAVISANASSGPWRRDVRPPAHTWKIRQFPAFTYSLIVTAKLNDVDPQAWPANVLARIADTPQNRLDELLPWSGQLPAALLKAA